MTSRAAPHLVLALVASIGGLAAALLFAEPAAAALAAPFALAVGVTLATPPPRIDRVAVRSDRDRMLVGDELGVTVSVEGTGLRWIEVRTRTDDHLVSTGGSSVAVAADRQAPFRFQATRWGGSTGISFEVCGRDLLGLRTVREEVRLGHGIRIHPTPARIRELVAPRHLSGLGGSHASRRRGEGFDYAESRPFVAGDRLRDVNWRMTSRRRSMWIDQRHPDLSGEVVLFLDSFATTQHGREEALGLAVEAGIALAGEHLGHQDRVGLVDLGGALRWVPTRLGRLQAHVITETLVESEVIETWADKGLDIVPRFALPPRSLVVALTPLADPRILRVLLALRARHHDLVVIECELPPPTRSTDRVAQLGQRLWALERQTTRSSLRRAGGSVVTWRRGTPLGPLLHGAIHERRRPHRVGA